MNNPGLKTKKIRQSKILEIIEKKRISTQEELAAELRAAGFESTQATVSRDIRELQLTKSTDSSGEYKYSAPDVGSMMSENKFARVLADAVITTVVAENLLIVKTYAGMANAACAAIDSMGWEQVAGSIAGDDTIFIACRSHDDAETVIGKINGIIV